MLLYKLILFLFVIAPSLSLAPPPTMPRKSMLKRMASLVGASLLWHQSTVGAFAAGDYVKKNAPASGLTVTKEASTGKPTVAYRTMRVDVTGVDVPVAMWYPIDSISSSSDIPKSGRKLTYDHKISVRRIGKLLAGWEFIPGFASKQFDLSPASSYVADGANYQLPSKGPVVLLAHGYLGSRFDLSHLAEALAQEGTYHFNIENLTNNSPVSQYTNPTRIGFICLSPEYPESLAASYEGGELDRTQITNQLLKDLTEKWGIQPTAYGIVGHSLGTGTALNTGDDTWARVCIAGFPRRRDGSKVEGNVLFVSSMNDGAVSPARFGGKDAIPKDITILDELTLPKRLPPRATLLFDRPDAPNHISFLTDEVNNAMIDLLSPLLPLAMALKIPVLDFDKYKESRDSKQTADVVIPLVATYLKQQMKV